MSEKPQKRKFAIVFEYPLDTKKTHLWRNYKSDLCEKFSKHFYTSIATDGAVIRALSAIEYTDYEFNVLKKQRDELLEALKSIRYIAIRRIEMGEGQWKSTLATARRAIQSVEGEDEKEI